VVQAEYGKPHYSATSFVFLVHCFHTGGLEFGQRMREGVEKGGRRGSEKEVREEERKTITPNVRRFQCSVW
jgi:hypothetical protein